MADYTKAERSEDGEQHIYSVDVSDAIGNGYEENTQLRVNWVLQQLNEAFVEIDVGTPFEYQRVTEDEYTGHWWTNNKYEIQLNHEQDPPRYELHISHLGETPFDESTFTYVISGVQTIIKKGSTIQQGAAKQRRRKTHKKRMTKRYTRKS